MHTIMEGIPTHTREVTLLMTSEKSAIPVYVELEECGVSGGMRVWGYGGGEIGLPVCA